MKVAMGKVMRGIKDWKEEFRQIMEELKGGMKELRREMREMKEREERWVEERIEMGRKVGDLEKKVKSIEETLRA